MNTAFVVLFVLLQVADIWTTHKALGLGKREANLLLAKLFTRFPPVPTMIVMKVPAVVLLWYADLFWVTAACCVLYGAVVYNNWNVIEGK